MARKDSGEPEAEDGPSDAWMVTFSDLLTLMITFFVLLLTMSSMDAKKVKNMFGLMPEAQGVLEMGSHREIGKPELITIIDNLASEFLTEKNIITNILEEMIKGEAGRTIEDLKGDVDLDSMVSLSEKGLVVTLADAILFEEGKAELSDEASQILGTIGAHLLKRKYLIHVEGHTGAGSSAETGAGWMISAKRANSVMKYLTDVAGVKKERVSSRGYAHFSPLVDNSTPENRAKNRRVEIVLSKKDQNPSEGVN